MSPSDIVEEPVVDKSSRSTCIPFLCDFIWNVKANEICTFNYISDVCNRKFSMYDQENQDNI